MAEETFATIDWWRQANQRLTAQVESIRGEAKQWERNAWQAVKERDEARTERDDLRAIIEALRAAIEVP